MTSSYTRIAAVTGGNKGIGLACVRQLALQYPQSAYDNGPLLIYLTARNEERGRAALKSIHEDPQLKKAKALQSDGGLAAVEYLPLDIDSAQSIDSFTSTLKKAHPDGIDVLINNAAVALDGFDADIVKRTLHSNYYGTLQATEQLLPSIRDGGRIVNVASQAGMLKVAKQPGLSNNDAYSPGIAARFRDAKSVAEITGLMEQFQAEVAGGTHGSSWPSSAYRVSKAGVIGMTRAVAVKNREGGSEVLINSCCPGYVNTDMTKGRGVKTPDEGARTPVLLALGDIGKSNGEFWVNEKVSSW